MFCMIKIVRSTIIHQQTAELKKKIKQRSDMQQASSESRWDLPEYWFQ